MGFAVAAPDFPAGCAIVFGGSGGLGRAIAGLLAERGADVVLTYRTRPQPAQAVAAEIRAIGRKASALPCELSDRAAVESVVRAAQAEYGRVHTVVSAGGLVYDTGRLAELRESSFRGVVETDVIGFFNISQAAVPALREGGGGAIVAIVTTALAHVVPRTALSAAPKAAVATMIKHLATEEGVNGIRANAVGPGVIDAGMVIPLRQGPSRKTMDLAIGMTPLRRFGRAEEVAETVVFLASAKAGYISGQVLMVDGGMLA
ncbi:MAG: SDR family oxidoreductase [Nevskia sp.]|nr:SDR family oxidoreductase [Nevskia sp.]